jgi:uncharacterized membrane protein YczE
MLAVAARAHTRAGVARTGIEIVALASGVALGGFVGVGTAVFALGIGPAVELGFLALGRSPLAAPSVAVDEAPASQPPLAEKCW